MEDKSSILIVDDDNSLTRTMTLVLERNGYSVATAKDGLEAIEMVKGTHFDLIFMDIKMPLMNGVDTFRRIQKMTPRAEVVVMMSAYSVEDLVREALREGARGFVRKPLDMEAVINLVEQTRRIKLGTIVRAWDESGDDITADRDLK